MKKVKASIRTGLMATTTLWGVAVGGLVGTALATTVVAMLPTAAEAQDYTSGALIGKVTANGAPVAGAKVTVTSKALGQTHVLTTSAQGSFSSTGLQPGDYDITVQASGYSDYQTTATVVISQEIRIDAALQTAGVQAVVVKGKRVRQDFTKTTGGITVDLDTLVAQEPIARNLTAVTMLAPTVTQGNPGFGNVASFGGSSVAENAYYIDGLNITNPDTYVGSATVPFDFYKTIEVKTSGFPAEYGRATGGVANATTKSGTNNFFFAVHGNYAPADLQADQADTYAYRGKFSTSKSNSLSVEMGGALIKDHLFAYGLYQMNDSESTSAGINSGAYTVTKNTKPFLGGKLDYYINPTQHLALTYFDTTHTNSSDIYTYTDSTQTIGNKTGHSNNQLGGKNWVLNYSGKVTDWFSVSAAVGDSKDANDVIPTNTAAYYVVDYSSGTGKVISTQQASSGVSTDETERKFYRLDGDMRFDWLGHHHVRFGFDDEKNSMVKTTKLTGTEPVQYQYRIVSGVKYLRVIYENLGGNVSSENYAGYLQDSWDITPTLNLQIGVRNDTFDQYNLSGEKYMHETGNWAPRLGFSWDPTGEGKWKVYGSYGSNYIPPAMNLGYRGKDLYFTQYYAAPAGGWVIDSTTGLPASVGAPVSLSSAYTDPCPASTLANAPGFTAATTGAGTAHCVVYGNGTQEGATSKTSVNLKATRQDEVTLGVDYKVNDLWSVGASAIYRTTTNISEDSDFNDAIISYLDAHGLDSSQWVGGSSYYVWNVGDHDVSIKLKNVLPGETAARTITLTSAELGHYQNAKRQYEAAIFTFKRAFDGKWGIQGSYTWSKLWGNYSGTVTEYGNGVQTDAGATYAWDSPGMESYGSGLLGNDRTHTLKVFGSYALTPDFMVGANLLIQSPEKFSCLGLNPVDDYSYGYGDVSHYCGGVPAPVGTGLKSDWTKNIDMSVRYTVPEKYAIGGKLILRADLFNVFDNHSVTTRYVTYDLTTIGQVDPNYGKATAYNTPRYLRLGFDLSY